MTSITRRLATAALATTIAAGALMVAALPASATPTLPLIPTLSIYAGDGTRQTPAAGPALTSPIGAPTGLAFDGSGNLYVAVRDSNVVLKVDTSGSTTVFAGTGTGGAPTPGPATSSNLSGPQDITVDSAGNVYIADSYNNLVEKVDTSGNLSIIAGTGTAGTIYTVTTPGPATNADIGSPSDVAVDSNGNLYIAAKGNNRVLKVDTNGDVSTFAGSGYIGGSMEGDALLTGMYFPTGVVVDADDNVYILDSNNLRVLKVTQAGVLTIFAGSGDRGTPTPGPATQSPLSFINSTLQLGIDASGNVYIPSLANNYVVKVTPGGTLSILAGNGSYGSPTPGTAAESRLSNPSDVAVNAAGEVFIADTWAGTVDKVALVQAVPSAPKAPTNLAYTRPAPGAVDVTFKAPADGYSSILRYEYKVATGPWTNNGLSTTIHLTGLTNYQNRNVWVRAVNAIGTGPSSATLTVRPRTNGPTITSSSATRTGLTVNFNGFTYPDATIQGYSVQAYKAGTNTLARSCTTGPTGRKCSMQGLTPGRSYDIRVVAYFTVGDSWANNETLEVKVATLTTLS